MSFHGGIEIDGSQVRATVVEGNPKKHRVVDFVEAQISGETDDERRDSLREILEPLFFTKERTGLDVATSMGADRAILREISVPYTKDEVIAKTIRYEGESYIFSHNIDDLVIEYLKCSESETGSRLVLCAVERDRISGELERYNAVDIDPMSIELNATALASAFTAMQPDDQEGSTLIVQIERLHTTFVLMEDGRITKVRSVWNVVRPMEPTSPLLTGGDEDDESESPSSAGEPGQERATIEDRFAEIEKSLSDIDTGETDPRRDGADSSDDDDMFVVLSDEDYARIQEDQSAGTQSSRSQGTATLALAPAGDPFERIILELERTFAGYLLGGSIERLVVTGGEAVELDALRRLSEHFEVEATELPLDRLELALPPEHQGEFRTAGAVSYGLALRSLGISATAFELRRGEFRFERRFERMMPSLTLASLLLCVLSLAWMVGEHRSARTYAQEVEVLRGRQAELYESFFGRSAPNDTKDFHSAARNRLKAIAGKSSAGTNRGARMKQYRGAMELCTEFYDAVRSSEPRVYPEYDLFDWNPEKKSGVKSTVKFHVKSDEKDNAQVLIDAIRNNMTNFTVVPSQKESRTGGVDVTLDLILKNVGS